MLGVFSFEKQDHGPHGVIVRISWRSGNRITEIGDGLVDGHDLGRIRPPHRAAAGRETKPIALDLIDAIDGNLRRVFGGTVRVAQLEHAIFGHDALTDPLLAGCFPGPHRSGLDRRQAES